MITKSITALIGMPLVASLLFIACSKDAQDSIDPAVKNTVSLEFDNRVGDQKLILGQTPYKNAAGEPFTVSAFNYFISNVSLTKDDGTVVRFPNQYFLIRQADAKTITIGLNEVPSGNYTALSFMVGVDSLKSVGGAGERVGVLDPTSYGTDGMYWSWNSGYIFLKFEGTSTAIPVATNPNQTFAIHVGGYGGGWNGNARTANNLRTISLPITTPATVRGNVAPTVHLLADARQLFDGPNKLSLAKTNSVHSPAVATPIADNIRSMFQVDHVHNEKQ